MTERKRHSFKSVHYFSITDSAMGFIAMVAAIHSKMHKLQSDNGSMSQADLTNIFN